MRRQLVGASILAALGWTSPAFGLGMGDIDSGSALNERFSARIPLRSAEGTDPRNINVSLASQEAFERAGIQRSAYLARLDFEVRKADNGDLYVEITSEEAIQEPFLNFLLRLRWPEGQLMREYTVLLDPPTYTDEPERQVAGEPSDGEQAADTTRGTSRADDGGGASRSASRGDSARSGGETGASPGSYGPVAANETLYGIANDVRPEGVTANQAMIAMLRANPQAFIDGNINRLREGAELEVPERGAMTEVSARQATQRVKEQIAAWREQRGDQVASASDTQDGGSAAAGEADADTSDAESSTGSGEGDVAQGQLDVQGVEEGADTDAQTSLLDQSLAANQQNVQRLQERVREVETDNESLQSQNEDLKQTVEQLKEELARAEAQNTGSGSAVQLETESPTGTGQSESESPGSSNGEANDSSPASSSAEEGAAGPAQQDAGASADGSQEETDQGGSATESTATAEPTDETQQTAAADEGSVTFKGDDSAGGESGDDSAEQESAPQDNAQTQAASQGDGGDASPDQQSQSQPDEGGGIMAWLMGNLMALAAMGGGVLVLLLAGILWLRRRGEATAEDEELAAPTRVPSLDEAPAAEGGAGDMATAGAQGSEMLDDAASGSAAGGSSDMLAQADAYIQAGDLGEAQDVLDAALGADPEDKELRYRLLDVLAKRGDRGGFEAEAQVLHTQLDSESDPLWQSTVALGREIAPEHPLFAGGEDSASESVTDQPAASGGGEAVPGGEPDSDTDFDLSFDLDEPAGASEETEQSGPATTAADSSSGDGDFDLDFDLDDEGSEPAAPDQGTPAEPAGAETDDLAFDLDTSDLGGGDAGTSEPDGEASAGGEKPVSEPDSGGLDFDLEFGDGSKETETSSASSGTAAENSDDTSLDFDLPDDLDLSFGDDDASEAGADSSASGSDQPDLGGEALSLGDVSDEADSDAPTATPDGGTGQDGGSEVGGDDFDSMDEVATKLDLAQAYLDMGDPEGAKGLLSEVVNEGDASQKQQAEELLEKAG